MMARKKKVVLYGSKGCGWCSRERDFLDRKGIEYEYREVNDEKTMRELLKVTNGEAATPVTVIGKKVVVGFDQRAIERELE